MKTYLVEFGSMRVEAPDDADEEKIVDIINDKLFNGTWPAIGAIKEVE